MGRAFEYRRAAKEKRWDKMSKVFPKLARTITMAAKEGGPDPDSNSKLRTAILNAKAHNMPKDNIETAIKRAAGKDMAEIVPRTCWRTVSGGKIHLFRKCKSLRPVAEHRVEDLEVCQHCLKEYEGRVDRALEKVVEKLVKE